MKPLYVPPSALYIPKSVHSPYDVMYHRRKIKVSSSDGTSFHKYGCSLTPGDRKYLIKGTEEPKTKTLDYISVPPGAGKTKWAVDYIVTNSRSKEEIIIYCAPTVILLKQVFLEVKHKFKHSTGSKLNISFRGVQDDTELKDYTGFKDMSDIRPMTYYASVLMENMGRGGCLFLTHATFLSLKEVFRKSRYHVIFDEAAEMQISPDRMQIDQKSVTLLNTMVSFELFPFDPALMNSKMNQHMIDRDCKPFCRLRCLDEGQGYSGKYKNFADITKNQKLADLIEKASDDQFSVYVREERTPSKNTYYFFDFVTPSGVFKKFGKVTLLSAFFEESLMFQILGQSYKLRNVNNKVDTTREKAIFEGYKNLEIVYLFDTPRPLSKNFLENAVRVRSGKHGHYFKFLEKYVPLVAEEMMLEERDAIKVLLDHITKEPNTRILKLMQRKLKEKDFDTFDYISKNVVSSAISIQKIIRNDLKERKKAGFKICDKPLIIANLGKSIQNKFGNNQHVDLLIPIHKDFEWLRTKSHGLNSFSKRNVFVSLAALNMHPHIHSFYSFLIPNFDTSILSTHTILQGVTRTRIRKIDNIKKVVLYVFSKKEAEAIQRAFRQNPTVTSLNANLDLFYSGMKPYYVPDLVKVARAIESKTKSKARAKVINSNYTQDTVYYALLNSYNKMRYAYKKLEPGSGDAKILRGELDNLNAKMKERRKFLKPTKIEAA